jgi:hypothetical protein
MHSKFWEVDMRFAQITAMGCSSSSYPAAIAHSSNHRQKTNGTSDMLFFGVGSATKNSYVESSTITTSLATHNCTSPPTSTCVSAPKALGGTSGIVIDNQLSNGGTNIYFSTLSAGSVNGQKCNVSGGTANPYCAVKLTESALQ